MKKLGTQLERVKARLAKFGQISRNECLRQYPAITRLAARIADLKEEKYEFREEDTGRDYIYHLVSVNGVSYHMPEDRAQVLKDNEARLKWFDDYQPTQTV